MSNSKQYDGGMIYLSAPVHIGTKRPEKAAKPKGQPVTFAGGDGKAIAETLAKMTLDNLYQAKRLIDAEIQKRSGSTKAIAGLSASTRAEIDKRVQERIAQKRCDEISDALFNQVAGVKSATRSG